MADQDIETNKNPNFEIISALAAWRMQAGIENGPGLPGKAWSRSSR
jgi:hypothetical protein